ncbi:MAG: OmpH family outer membrane protein [Planctomycetaceae bacterium]
MNVRLAVIAIVAAAGLVPARVSAQGPAPAAVQPAASTAPRATGAAPATHTAVIDIGYIFKNHTRFKAAMDKMKDEVMAAENSLKAEKDRINGLIEQLRGLNVGTPDFKRLEAEVAKAQGDFQVNAGLQKKDFMDREAKVYMQVYGEIEEAVKQFARQHGIAVVHRFDGEPVDAANRDRILGNIMKPIVYHDPLIDITPDVLRMLNASSVAGVPAAQPR